MRENRFNVRVYGILKNDLGQVLLIHETRNDFSFTKFPGGGLEWGEGLADCLVREFKEETGLHITIEGHLYTTDFFQQSAFCSTDQLISVYYYVKAASVSSLRLDLHEVTGSPHRETFRFEWADPAGLEETRLTFPIDRIVSRLLKSR